MRFAVLLVLLAALQTGSSPAAVAPPRLLGLSVSNGGHPFFGDTRRLATVSPNGDGFRDRALIRFHLDRPATVELQVVATGLARKPGTVLSRTRRSLGAGPFTMTWKPPGGTADRTYLLRFVVKGKDGGARVYGFERPRPGQPTSGLVVRVLAVDVAFLQRSYPQGAQASASIATDARSVSVQFFGYPGPGSPGEADPRTGAVAMTPAVTLDWRGNRNGPHVVDFGPFDTWSSGLYFLRVTAPDGRTGYAPLILRPRRLGDRRVAVVLPTNTWQADNLRDANGDGWADSWNADGSRRAIDLRRPYLDFGLPFHLRSGSGAVVAWLSQTHKEADFLSDDDLAAVASGDELRRDYDLIVFPGSEEYVSKHAYDVVRRFRDLGGRLMFLSGANFHWRAERSASTLTRIRPWRQLGLPEAALVGVQYAAANGGGGKPYVVEGALTEPWVFAGTGLADGTSFGSFGTEIDARAGTSPQGTVVLARIPQAIGGHAAEMTFYTTPEGAQVFAAGTLDFAASMGLPGVARLVENVWARLAP